MKLIDDRTELVRRRLGGEGERGARAIETLRKRTGEYGIEIIDVRVRRFSYPEAVRSSIAERIRSERAKKVADYESEGRQKAAEISAEADRVARTREADARAQKTVIEGQANADAARIRAAAYGQDRDFYLFLESLRAFQIDHLRDARRAPAQHQAPADEAAGRSAMSPMSPMPPKP